MRPFISKIWDLLQIKWTAMLAIIAGILMFAFLCSLALAPLNQLRSLQQFVNADSAYLESRSELDYHPDIIALLKEKAYKDALLDLSNNDSIQLVINLSDSTVNLSIKGVMIQQTKIVEFHKDKFLRNLPSEIELRLLSDPFPVKAQYATIVKEPVVVRYAPKDTLEAALNAWQPDTLIQNPAFVRFSLDHDLNIIFEQDESTGFNDRWKRFTFYSHLRSQRIFEVLREFFSARKMQYHPTIRIKMPVDDLRAVYRALPGRAYVVIKL